MRRSREAYIAGLEESPSRRRPQPESASVASFFVSRIDTLVDAMLESKLKTATDAEGARAAAQPHGQSGHRQRQARPIKRTRDLLRPALGGAGEKGAQTQRLLWASTSTKNPSYRDMLYVEELIGPDTVNTIPPATFDAFRDHGKPRASLEDGSRRRARHMDTLASRRHLHEEVTDELVTQASSCSPSRSTNC